MVRSSTLEKQVRTDIEWEILGGNFFMVAIFKKWYYFSNFHFYGKSPIF